MAMTLITCMPTLSPFPPCNAEPTAATDECQNPSTTADADLGVSTYGFVTLAAVEVHPQAPHSTDDVPQGMPTPPPNLVPDKRVMPQPTQHFVAPPPLPPPRRMHSPAAPAEDWEMSYSDVSLREAVGWGNFGIVVLGTLLDSREDDQSLEPDEGNQKLVAVKRLRGRWAASGMYTLYTYFVRLLILKVSNIKSF